ncbi:MAG: MYXO-CTERM sorting domain-containing protein, partial [Kofleriaceae bacterium]
GGTSAASPLVAGIFALTKNGNATAQFAYLHTAAFYDVTSGKNGSCTTALCKAAAGWDGPTGVGTPNGAMLAAISGQGNGSGSGSGSGTGSGTGTGSGSGTGIGSGSDTGSGGGAGGGGAGSDMGTGSGNGGNGDNGGTGDPEHGGCSTTGNGGFAGGLLVIGFAFVTRRRRR